MKEVLLKLKKLISTPFEPKHEKTVYSVCITSIVFILVIVWMSFSNTSDKLDLLKKNVRLELMIGERDTLITDLNTLAKKQSDLIKEQDGHLTEVFVLATEQGVILKEKEDELNEIKSALYIKTIYYSALVEYMKKIGEWPPKIKPPLDPDNITEAQSNETKTKLQKARASSQVVVWRKTAN